MVTKVTVPWSFSMNSFFMIFYVFSLNEGLEKVKINYTMWICRNRHKGHKHWQRHTKKLTLDYSIFLNSWFTSLQHLKYYHPYMHKINWHWWTWNLHTKINKRKWHKLVPHNENRNYELVIQNEKNKNQATRTALPHIPSHRDENARCSKI